MGRGGSHALSPPLSFFFLVPPRLSVDGAVWLGAFDRTRVFRFFSQRVCSEKRACFRCPFSRGSVPLCGRSPAWKAFGLLVALGSRRRRLSTCALSTSSSPTALRDLISGGASCLDAFSTYPCQTRIPGGAPGGTTGSPVVCPARSSRTSVGSPQISYAHNR